MLQRIAERFATALDADDYEAAGSMLDENANYDDGQGRIISGKAAVIESFRAASERGRRELDALEFRHEIDPASPASIRFIDELTLDGDTFLLDHTMLIEIHLSRLFVHRPMEN